VCSHVNFANQTGKSVRGEAVGLLLDYVRVHDMKSFDITKGDEFAQRNQSIESWYQSRIVIQLVAVESREVGYLIRALAE
jgi:hypothetical protein